MPRRNRIDELLRDGKTRATLEKRAASPLAEREEWLKPEVGDAPLANDEDVRRLAAKSSGNSVAPNAARRMFNGQDFKRLTANYADRNAAALHEIRHLFKGRDKVVAWVIGLGGSPVEHEEVAEHLRAAGVRDYEVYAADIQGGIVRKMGAETAHVKPVQLDALLATPVKRPDLIVCLNTTYQSNAKMQKWLAANFAEALNPRGFVITESRGGYRGRVNPFLDELAPALTERKFKTEIDELFKTYPALREEGDRGYREKHYSLFYKE
ncbi:hypothetical protein COX86_01435 [Candidatus Micrarchaeota archaeon CG_4_10_14_0_2_um_filter_60_11]|nr:MAG: hypothetical protein AUJ16_01305 [Candidatus Micrarchaeota archaeon CG1_02_60_51]PIN96357.1 MAG: hypothetical protein COU39_01670 [Candidatus Micrarchaeota archaeon CG10_big_fil_rev_8_21_14_0_10_60_32]PIY91843.1 MAG: hypothetical protein COY71_01035 [Candidatus Micrarchaeota archaeon CG_4_10_14_0_8_um_filter_60_7]PIZ91124.1 MAG: hypothetical protein COX86_01435 [Candidatus Micrarchaeota archaeon CG_4_10_14_0_2_um_filter_60_11]